jgi:hypothetical protein
MKQNSFAIPNDKQYHFKHLHNMIQITPDQASTETTEPFCCTKKVSFKSTVRVYLGLKAKDYTVEERVACWLSRTEMSCIKSNVRATVQLLCEASLFSEIDTSKICTRGLEPMLPQEAAARMHRRKDSIWAVLREQQEQRDNDEDDVDLIADIYKKSTGFSQSVAQTMAQQDERFFLDEREKYSCSRQMERDASCRKTARSEALAMGWQESKRRFTTSGRLYSVDLQGNTPIHDT